MNNPQNPSKRYTAEQAFNEALAHLDQLSKAKEKPLESKSNQIKEENEFPDSLAWEDAGADLEAFFQQQQEQD